MMTMIICKSISHTENHLDAGVRDTLT